MRIDYFDNLKFILIALVVLGHFVDPFGELFPAYRRVYFFVYLFHMPLFMYITGMFSRRTLGIGHAADVARSIKLPTPQQDRTIAPAAGNPAKSPRPLLPALNRAVAFTIIYLMLNFAIFAIQRYLRGTAEPFNPLNVPNVSWYLLTCAILTLISMLPFVNAANNNAKSRLLIISLCTAIALIIGKFDFINDYFTLSRLVCFLPFFLAGLYTDPKALADVMSGKRRIKAFHAGKAARAAAAAIIICAIIIVIIMPDEYLRLRGILTARNPYSYLDNLAAYGWIFRLIWYAAALVLGVSLMLIVPRCKTFFTRLGRGTLGVFIWHSLALRLLGAASLVPWTAALTQEKAVPTAILMSIPVALAIAATLAFSLNPPFGVIASKIMKLQLIKTPDARKKQDPLR